ncbi:enoyl-ACP reductase-like protein [Kribbella sp. VKM Ac-2527]|uniref:Enoyl-ACP reductase-like protein n=1 Tax=Kribbella caucasensis TaxID=2512215 RepID=A0A4R6KQ42_9ACTN|nr:SDR family oxidoreductase [Kribbella sp. VKM Ac-2527]TDO51739.1 enoyl-ACP reductase-like protein [Kribbella sp. VKM Ac-2527]
MIRVRSLSTPTTSEPIGRNDQPEEVAGPIVFLLSQAAGFITGTNLIVDGRFTIW